MSVFYGTIISTYIFSLLAKIAHDKKFKSLAIFWLMFVALILILVSGLRNGIGDTTMYMHSFNLAVENPSAVKFDRDAGFKILTLILTSISVDPQILIFVTALITNLLNVISFNKYRSYLELQVYMYITSGYYIVTMNGIRQCLAASLVLLCTPFIINGKFKHYCIAMIIISTLHESALFMIPVYFIARQEAWSKNMYRLIILAVLGILLYDLISPILFKLLENTQYGEYSEFNEGGSSIMRTIVNAVPVILAYLKRDELKNEWPMSDIFVNLSIINVIFVSFGMVNWIFNRFTLYLQLYNFILLPYLIKVTFKGKEKRLIYFGLMICYFIFFYYEQVIGMGMSYPTKYTFEVIIQNLFYK